MAILGELGMDCPVSGDAERDIEILAGSVNVQRLSNNPVAFDKDQLAAMYRNIVRQK